PGSGATGRYRAAWGAAPRWCGEERPAGASPRPADVPLAGNGKPYCPRTLRLGNIFFPDSPPRLWNPRNPPAQPGFSLSPETAKTSPPTRFLRPDSWEDPFGPGGQPSRSGFLSPRRDSGDLPGR